MVEIKIGYIFAPAIGRLAQLVQSTSFTPRGSGVRIPHRPQKSSLFKLDFFIFNTFFCVEWIEVRIFALVGFNLLSFS